MVHILIVHLLQRTVRHAETEKVACRKIALHLVHLIFFSSTF